MKRLLIVSLFFIFASIDIFAQSKPDSNAVFNYYVACATGDVKAAENFLIQYPDCVDIELSFDNFFEEQSSSFKYLFKTSLNFIIHHSLNTIILYFLNNKNNFPVKAMIFKTSLLP